MKKLFSLLLVVALTFLFAGTGQADRPTLEQPIGIEYAAGMDVGQGQPTAINRATVNPTVDFSSHLWPAEATAVESGQTTACYVSGRNGPPTAAAYSDSGGRYLKVKDLDLTHKLSA